jgi:hypothetical protein
MAYGLELKPKSHTLNPHYFTHAYL